MWVMDATQFRNQLEELWRTRPVRPAGPRTVAGVCSGIAFRYRVDPTLVKVAFVVSTLFGGSGLILYVAAWIAFPSSTAVAARPDGHRRLRRDGRRRGDGQRRGRHGGHNNPKLLVLIVVCVVILTSIGPRGTWGSGALLGMILMVLGWWLLFRRTPEPAPGTSADTLTPEGITPAADQFQRWTPRGVRVGATSAWPSAPADPRFGGQSNDADGQPTAPLQNASTTTTADTTAADPTPAFGSTNREPPSWDPLGAARFAWDLPEPTEPETAPQPVEHRSPKAPLLVFGATLVVAMAGVAAHQAGVEWFSVTRILSMALAVVGIGMVAIAARRGSAQHRTGGLVPLAITLGVAVIVSAAVTGWSAQDGGGPIPPGGVGERTYAPMRENDIRDAYSVSVGDLELDLRSVDLTTDRTVDLRAGVGQVTVRVPRDMNVRANCTSNVGEAHCPEGLSIGSAGNHAPVLTINAHNNLGNVEVLR